MRRTLCLTAVLFLACTGGSEGEPIDEPDSGGETDSDTDVDADSDTDSGSWLEPTDPVFVADFDGTEWPAQDGHWLAGSTSYLTGTKGDGELVIVLSGDISHRGEYEVTQVTWFETIHNGYAFNYETTGGDATLTIDGLDVDGDHIWGTWSGSIELTDSEGAGDTILDDVQLESWLRYGAK